MTGMTLDEMIDAVQPALRRGRRGAPAQAPSYLRDISPEDLPTIMTSPAAPPAERPMLKIRHQHHQVARLLADGMKPADVAAVTGYTPARVQQLQRDPAFAELLAHYKEIVGEQYINVHERLAGLGVRVTEEIMERLEENPDAFSNEELRRLAETTLDRGGYGPKSVREVNVNTTSKTMSLVALVKAEEAGRGQVRQVTNLLEEQDALIGTVDEREADG